MNLRNLVFKQLFDSESSTYTYLLGDRDSGDAIIIDPVKSKVRRDLTLIKELGLNLKLILDTHVHADHVTGSYDLRQETGAKIVLSKESGASGADIYVSDKDKLKFGSFDIDVILTPGHTNGCTTYNIENMLFTGDTLLVRSCGRTDFQQGSAEVLYDSIMKLFEFEDTTIVYPGHNYEGITSSSIGEEKAYNKFIGSNKSKEEFVEAMNNRELPLPKFIKIAVPSNLILGERVIESDE